MATLTHVEGEYQSPSASTSPLPGQHQGDASHLAPPFLRLPPELVLRILSFVARLGVPSDLAHLRATSTTFYILLNDPGRSVEQRIWRRSAGALLDVCIPSVLTLDPTWQEFVKRTWRLSKPRGEEDGNPIRKVVEAEQFFTTHGGPFSPPKPYIEDEDYELLDGHAKGTLSARLTLDPIPPGARRVIDFVHSGTEGARGELTGTAYCGADAGAFFTFADDSREWAESQGSLQKGFILGGRAGDERGAMPVTAGVLDLSDWMVNKDEVEDAAEPLSFAEWVRSCVHSDANLNLIPKVAKTEVRGIFTGTMAEVIVAKVIRYSAPGVVDKVWDLEKAVWEGNPSTTDDDGTPKKWLGPWTNDSNWEFRSAGDYLIICDDNSSRRASTVTCFASGICKAPLWQRTMDGQGRGALGQPHAFFYDNDGIRMNSALVAYACRLKGSATNPPNMDLNRNVMEFLLLSTQTGRTLRILNIPQEDRPQIREGQMALYAWCSFSLSDSILVATLGGRTPSTSAATNYQFREAYIWDLVAPYSSSSSPTYAVRLPKSWNLIKESWTALSPDGRWLGIQVSWEIGVWDLETKSKVGVWRMADAQKHMHESRMDMGDRVWGWNSVWVKYRDIYDSPPPPNSATWEEGQPRPASPASFHTAVAEPPVEEVHHVVCYTNRVLRRIFDRNLIREGLQEDQQHDEYPDSIFSSDDDDSEDLDFADEFMDDDVLSGAEYDYEYYYDDDYEDELDTDDEALLFSLTPGAEWGVGGGDPEWEDTDGSLSEQEEAEAQKEVADPWGATTSGEGPGVPTGTVGSVGWSGNAISPSPTALTPAIFGSDDEDPDGRHHSNPTDDDYEVDDGFESW